MSRAFIAIQSVMLAASTAVAALLWSASGRETPDDKAHWAGHWSSVLVRDAVLAPTAAETASLPRARAEIAGPAGSVLAEFGVMLNRAQFLSRDGDSGLVAAAAGLEIGSAAVQPMAQSGLWAVAGEISAPAAGEQQPFVAVIDRVCESNVDRNCWQLVDLVTGSEALAGVPTLADATQATATLATGDQQNTTTNLAAAASSVAETRLQSGQLQNAGLPRDSLQAPLVESAPETATNDAATDAMSASADAAMPQTASLPPADASDPAPLTTSGPELVRQVQIGLNALDFGAGPADGQMGPRTREAITRYQADHGLPVDGLASVELLAHIALKRSRQMNSRQGENTVWPTTTVPALAGADRETDPWELTIPAPPQLSGEQPVFEMAETATETRPDVSGTERVTAAPAETADSTQNQVATADPTSPADVDTLREVQEVATELGQGVRGWLDRITVTIDQPPPEAAAPAPSAAAGSVKIKLDPEPELEPEGAPTAAQLAAAQLAAADNSQISEAAMAAADPADDALLGEVEDEAAANSATEGASNAVVAKVAAQPVKDSAANSLEPKALAAPEGLVPEGLAVAEVLANDDGARDGIGQESNSELAATGGAATGGVTTGSIGTDETHREAELNAPPEAETDLDVAAGGGVPDTDAAPDAALQVATLRKTDAVEQVPEEQVARDVALPEISPDVAVPQDLPASETEVESLPQSTPEPEIYYDQRMVLQIQSGLNAMGFKAGREDGWMGPRTGGAIAAYQRRHGLAEDGVPSLGLLAHLTLERTRLPSSQAIAVTDTPVEPAEPTAASRNAEIPVSAEPSSAGPVLAGKAKSGRYLIQLGSRDSLLDAMRVSQQVKALLGPALKDVRASFQPVNLGAEGTVYSTHYGPIEDWRAAEEACARIQVQNQSCAVVRESDGNGAATDRAVAPANANIAGAVEANIAAPDIRVPETGTPDTGAPNTGARAQPAAVALAKAAVELQRQGDSKQAIDFYTRAIASGDLSPESLAYAHNNRGAARKNVGLYDHAIADYGRAIELKRNFPRAYYNRGIAYYGQGFDDLALNDYDQAILLKPGFAAAYHNRGHVHLRNDDPGRAIADYSRAIEQAPDFDTAYFSRGEAYEALGDFGRAAADFEKAYAIDSSNSLYRAKLTDIGTPGLSLGALNTN